MIVEELMRRAEIAEPCTANWEEMTGDEKVRMCAQCHLNVYNAAEMTDEEVMLKIMSLAGGNRVCMRIFRRADGTFLTKNCPVGVRKLQERARRAAVWFAGGLSMLLATAAGAKDAAAPDLGAKRKPVWHSLITADKSSDQKTVAQPSSVTPVTRSNQMPPGAAGGISMPCYSDEQVRQAEEKVDSLQKEKGSDQPAVGQQLQLIGMMYYWQQKYPQSEKAYLRAIDVFEKLNNKQGVRACCLQMSMLCSVKKDEAGRISWQKRAEANYVSPNATPKPEKKL